MASRYISPESAAVSGRACDRRCEDGSAFGARQNQRLRHALYHMARVAMQRDAHFSQVYTALRAKGQRHGQALRNIGDRLLRILMAMLRHRTCYDASQIRCAPVVQMG